MNMSDGIKGAAPRRGARELALGFALLVGLTACSGGAGSGAASSDPPPVSEPQVGGPPPDPVQPDVAEAIDLRHWRLTIPADANGGVLGSALIVETASLIATPAYQSAWFYTDAAQALHFWVPVNGAISGTSTHPRSELREMLDPDNAAINWSSAGYSELLARCAVVQTPSVSRGVVVGQVHAYRSNGPLLLLRFTQDPVSGLGEVVAIINPTPSATASQRKRYTLATGLRLDEAFDYRMAVDRGVLSVEVNGNGISYPIGTAWAGAGHFFKAGAYILDEDGDANDGAHVAFFRLAVTHR